MSREQELIDIISEYSRNTTDDPDDAPPDYVIDAMNELDALKLNELRNPVAHKESGE